MTGRHVPFGLHTTTPPPTDPTTIMQRADEVNIVQRMLSDAQTSAVMLIGSPGAGKSTLAALLYHRLVLAKQAHLVAPHFLVWLGLSAYTTLPDLIAAILDGLGVHESDIFLLKPEQQLSILLHTLRRPQENALVVLDQCESLLHPEMSQGGARRGALPLFLELLQTDLGASRILLTGYSSPYDQQGMQGTRVRSYLVSRISIPEGVALLHQRGIQDSPEELSLLWQRCAGHAFALVLSTTLHHLSGISLGHLLLAPEYQPLWSSEVTLNLIAMVHRHLSPIQHMLMRALSLFDEPVPLQALAMVITGSGANEQSQVDDLYASFERALRVLTQLSLVQSLPNESGVCHYSLHLLLRQYVVGHYLEGSERHPGGRPVSSLGVNAPLNPMHYNPEALQIALAAGHMQVAAYYESVTRERCPPREQRAGIQDVEPIISTLRHLCLGWHWQQACDLLFEEGLHESMVQWGAWNTLIGLYTSFLPPFGMVLRRDEGQVSSHLGMLYGRLGENQQSQAYFQQALAIQREIGDQHGVATTLANQGELFRMRGDREQARINFEQVRAFNRNAGQQQDLLLESVVLHNLGLLYHEEKNYQQALTHYLEALRLMRYVQSSANTATILTNLGILFYEQGQHQEAMAILLPVLKLHQTQHDPAAVALKRFLTAIAQKMGPDAYEQLCQAALGIQQQLFSRFMTLDMRQ